MSLALRDVLLERADRAETAPTTDPQAFAALARERAEARRRTRRNALAAGGGVTLVAALVVGAVVLPSSGHDHRSSPAGGTPTPASSALHAVTTALSDQLRAERSAAAAAASVAASSRAGAIATPVRSLVQVSTPKAAAVAIGLVPKGWRYLGRGVPLTYYGPDTMAPTNNPDFADAIVVDVHERINSDNSTYTLTVDGRPARYSSDSGVTVVTVVVDSTTELDVQLPVTAPVTRTQALKIAATLDLRSKAEKTHG